MRKFAWITYLVFSLSVLTSSCHIFDSYEGRPDDDPVPQTKILRFELTPDTVLVNDTLLVHCVIEDSLDTSFEFNWKIRLGEVVPINGSITNDKIKWVASGFDYLDSGEVANISTGVIIDNGSEDSSFVHGTFNIIVRQD